METNIIQNWVNTFLVISMMLLTIAAISAIAIVILNKITKRFEKKREKKITEYKKRMALIYEQKEGCWSSKTPLKKD